MPLFYLTEKVFAIFLLAIVLSKQEDLHFEQFVCDFYIFYVRE